MSCIYQVIIKLDCVRRCVGPMKLAITVDNYMMLLYVDGVLVPQLPNWNNWVKVDLVDIPADTRVIAVKAGDEGVSSSLI